MGLSKNRRRQFFADNPICYNCGVNPATTIDHVPARECFHHKVGPEGFEFPACEQCNFKLSKIEQAFALLIRLGDFTPDSFNQTQFAKLVQGVRNNNPQLLPSDFSSNREKRNWLKDIGYQLSPGELVADAPVLKMDPSWRTAMDAFSRKLLTALFYKEAGRPLSQENLMRTVVVQYVDGKGQQLLEKVVPMLPLLRVGERRTTNIGDQFLYAFGVKPKDDMFVFFAQFAKSWFVLGATAKPTDVQNKEGYIQHKDNLAMEI